MSPSRPFILRPVATTLLMAAILLVGIVGYIQLPVSALPEVDYPTIQVITFYPGASPEVMAATVATPLERHLGAISDVDDMTSNSGVGTSNIQLTFGLDRDIDGAARDVQAARAHGAAYFERAFLTDAGRLRLLADDIDHLRFLVDGPDLTEMTVQGEADQTGTAA